MARKTYIRINADGTSEYVVEDSTPRLITDSIINSCGLEAPRRFQKVFKDIRGNLCKLIVEKGEAYVVTELDHIKLKTFWKPMPNGLLAPVFCRESENKEGLPQMTMEWRPQFFYEDMKILFAARIYNFNNAIVNPETKADASCYLITVDKNKRTYKLPLPNLFEDLAMCMGQFDGKGQTAQDAFAKAMHQFDSSEWNSDLRPNQDWVNQMFSFAPHGGEFRLSSCAGDWRRYCTPASTSIIQTIIG